VRYARWMFCVRSLSQAPTVMVVSHSAGSCRTGDLGGPAALVGGERGRGGGLGAWAAAGAAVGQALTPVLCGRCCLRASRGAVLVSACRSLAAVIGPWAGHAGPVAGDSAVCASGQRPVPGRVGRIWP
jgi:hypothetical protein